MGQSSVRDGTTDKHGAGAERRVLGRRPVVLMLAATFVQFIGYNLFYAAFPVHSQEALDWDAGHLGGFFSLMALAMIITEGPVLAALSKRLAPVKVFAMGAVLLAAAFLCLLGSSDVAVYGAAVLYAAGNGLAWPTFQARLSEVAGASAQGEVQGAATSASSAASILGLLAGAFLYGSLTTGLFVISAAIFGLVAVSAPRLFRP